MQGQPGRAADRPHSRPPAAAAPCAAQPRCCWRGLAAMCMQQADGPPCWPPCAPCRGGGRRHTAAPPPAGCRQEPHRAWSGHRLWLERDQPRCVSILCPPVSRHGGCLTPPLAPAPGTRPHRSVAWLLLSWCCRLTADGQDFGCGGSVIRPRMVLTAGALAARWRPLAVCSQRGALRHACSYTCLPCMHAAPIHPCSALRVWRQRRAQRPAQGGDRHAQLERGGGQGL